MPTKEYQEAVSELLNILDNTDEELVKKIPTELILFWERNKSEEYIPELDHNLSLEEMKLKTKTRQLIAMIYINYLCDPKKKKDIKKILMEMEQEPLEKNSNDIIENNNNIIDKGTEIKIDIDLEKENKDKVLNKEKNNINEKDINKKIENISEEKLEKTKSDIYLIEEKELGFFRNIINKIKRFFKKNI